MKKIFCYIVLFIFCSSFTYAPAGKIIEPAVIKSIVDYSNFSAAGVSENVFHIAVKGYSLLQQKGLLKKNNLLTIIDYSKSSTQKRLFVLNIATGKVLFSSLVAHGKNSGQEYATSFSNENESNKSSLGFYTTGGSYFGENGYSLKLNGCERGFNDAAYDRAIVIHGADYVSNDIIKAQGFLGRSFGCPAVPQQQTKRLIDLIKGGTCLFIYQPNKSYLTKSRIINS